MEQIGLLTPMVVFAFAFGWVWQHILRGVEIHWLQLLPYPLMGIVIGEGFWATNLAAGPEFLGVHIAVALVSTFVAVGLKTLVETYIRTKGYGIHLSLGSQKSNAKERDVVHTR